VLTTDREHNKISYKFNNNIKLYIHLILYLHVQASRLVLRSHNIFKQANKSLYNYEETQAGMLGSTHERRDKNLAKRPKRFFENVGSGAADRMTPARATDRQLGRAG
jgi:hypothetical protein